MAHHRVSLLVVVVALIDLVVGQCMSQLTCDTCVEEFGCQWCASGWAGGYCTNEGFPCLPGQCAWGSCDYFPSCSAYADCGTCTSSSLCGWCADTKTCMIVFEGMPCGATCSKLDTSPAQCDACQPLTSCSSCAAQTGCQWCPTTDTCSKVGSTCSSCPAVSTSQCGPDQCSGYGSNCTACVADPQCGYCGGLRQCQNKNCKSWCPLSWNEGSCAAYCSSMGTSVNECAACTGSLAASCGFCYTDSNGQIDGQCLEAVNGSIVPPNANCLEWIAPGSQQTCACVETNNCSSCVNTTAAIANVTLPCGWCGTQGAPTGYCAVGNSSGPTDFVCVNAFWSIDTCSPHGCPRDCSGQGVCNDLNGTCTCNANWFGPSCNCTQSVALCQHGTCNDTTGGCDCNEDYYGVSCAIYCDANSTCNGNGQCRADGTCQCNEYYSGPTCYTYCEPNVTCSGHGQCLANGACKCDQYFSSANCSNFDAEAYCVTLPLCSVCTEASVELNFTTCRWCEAQNQCFAPQSTYPCSNAMTSCEGSCTSLTQAQCLRAHATDDGLNSTTSPLRCSCMWCSAAGLHQDMPMCMPSYSSECVGVRTHPPHCTRLNLPLTIGGATAGGVLLIILVALVIYCCCRESQSGYQQIN